MRSRRKPRRLALLRKSNRDGLPNVILEAATQALPILSTDFAGVPEFIIADETGLLVAPGDSAALARELTRLARDHDLRKRLGEAAYARIKTAFSFDAGVDDLASKLMASQMRAPVA